MKRLKYLAMAALVAFAACDEGDDISVVQPVTGTVSGTVSAEGAGVAGVTVTLAGPTSQTTTTGSNGSYTFSNVDEGAYAVTISGVPADYVFSSTTKTAVISQDGQTVTVDFGGNIVRSASISGQVTASGTGVGGVAVQISGPEGTETKQTGASGNFSFTGLRAGSYTISITNPNPAMYTFGVTSQTVALSAGEAENVNFSGTATMPGTIQGSVLASGNAVGGATITISQGGTTVATRTTNASGAYSANVDAGTYTVTLSGFDATKYSFSSTTRTVEVSSGETEDVSFGGAEIIPGSISGVVIASGSAVGGVTVSLSGAATRSVITDANGAYSFTNLNAGSYTVSISGYDNTIYTFPTTSQSVTLAQGGSEVASFTGTRSGTGGEAASVAIERIVTAGTLAPIANNALGGTMVIQVGVNEGDNEVTQLDVMVDGTTVCTQTFSATSSGPAGVGEEFDIDCTWTSAAFNATTGVPTYLNGPVTVTAQITTASGTTRTASLNGTLFNADAIIATVTPTDIENSPATGLSWWQGPITAEAMAVMYSGRDAARITMTVGGATNTDTTPADGFTFSFPISGSAAAANFIGALEAAGVAITATGVTSTGATFAAATPITTQNIDNVAPSFTVGAGTAAGNLPASRWINDAFTFGGVTAVDGGVAGTTLTFEAGTSASTLQPVTSGADLTESLTNNNFVVRVTATDELGNSFSRYIDGTPAGTGTIGAATQIGVDFGDPVILGNIGTLSAQEPIVGGNSLISLNLQADNLSGYSGTPVRLYVNRYTPSATTCVVDGSAATGCQPASFDTTFDYFVDPVTGFPTAGYYRAVYYVTDMAANTSATTTQTNVYDVTFPTVGGIGFDAQLTAGANETFNAPVSDNLDLDEGAFYLQYGAGPWLELQETSLGGFGPDDGFNTQGFFSPTVDFVASVEIGFGSAPSLASNARADVMDFGNNLTTSTTGIPAANISGAATTSFNNAARGPSGQVNAATTTITNATICQDRDADGCTNPTSTAVTLRIDGATGQLLNLFPEVYFYVEKNNAGSNLWERVGQAAVSIQDDGGAVFGRRYAYSATLNSSSFAFTTAGPGWPTEAHTIGILAIAADGTALWVTQGVTLSVD